MKNIETLNILRQRVEYSRLDEESIREVLDIIDGVEADILDILDGALENEEMQIENGVCERFEVPKRTVDDVMVYDIFHKEDMFNPDFTPKADNVWMEYGLSNPHRR